MEDAVHLPRALDRGLRLFEWLAGREDGAGFADLGSALAIPDNSLARLLAGLAAEGWIEHVGGRYRLAPRTRALVAPLTPWQRLREDGAHIAQALAESAGACVLVIGWDGEYMHCLARCAPPGVRSLQSPGRVARNWRSPPWGWFFKGRAYWRRQRRHDGGGGPWRRDILVELDRLERDGYCLDLQRDRRRLAAPVCIRAEPIGALALGGTAIDLHDDDLARAGRRLVEHARGLEQLLAGPTVRGGPPAWPGA